MLRHPLCKRSGQPVPPSIPNSQVKGCETCAIRLLLRLCLGGSSDARHLATLACFASFDERISLIVSKQGARTCIMRCIPSPFSALNRFFFFVCYVRLNATVPLPGFFVVFLSLLCLCCERVIAFSSLFSLMFLFGFGKTRRKSLRLANWTACLSVTEPSAARQRTEGGRTAHVYGAVFAWNVVSCLSYFCADGAPF